ncbi:D-inositol 3-phosphate glycosyltransferase [Posidoniimonas polymericola]|uniref:D-inositol 3-phosphate glycosyltransferase n=1 Tax=Posidoniimonas polymericola TaxID=2528002 RepID=A0A5C5YHQ5_9BACT|nr:D-inositol 3-phosphate glycosyltransferase [Posidoniimonas polymericola]
MRIGFISLADPSDPNAISGMPFHAASALAATGAEVVPLTPGGRFSDKPAKQTLAFLPRAIRKNPQIRNLRNAVRDRLKSAIEQVQAAQAYDRLIGIAESMSADIGRQLDSLDRPLDALFGVCISSPLYALKTDLPIVYFSDATARLVATTYAKWTRMPETKKQGFEEIESVALSRTAAGLFASQCTLDSAINDYGLSPDRAHLLPLGSTVVPDAYDTIHIDLPSRERLELIIVAADPIRKRLDLCVEITRELAARGWNVTLHSIGGHTRAALSCERVRVHGFLSMGDPIDRDIHKTLLRRSHFMLLPSTGEMFGIAPGEAAHFGRPSLVSAVGGLPTAVQHGKTGLCLPVDASAKQYADEIERLADNPDQYRAMSEAALERARTTLNWPAFGRRAIEVIRDVVENQAERRPRVCVGAE